MSDNIPERQSSEEIKKLSAESEKLLAEAKLKQAEAQLTTARTPIIDKLIVRGLIPIALAIVGPWAIWKFDADVQNTKDRVVAQTDSLDEQRAVVRDLKKILDAQIKSQEKRASEEASWRERLSSLDEQRANEISSLGSMLSRLESIMKMTLLRIAIDNAINDANLPADRKRRALITMKKDIISRSVQQMEWSKANPREAERMAKEIFDRILETP